MIFQKKKKKKKKKKKHVKGYIFINSNNCK